MRRWHVPAIAIAVWGCAGRRDASSPRTGEAAGEQVFATTCLDCHHEPAPPVPNLAGKLEPALAKRALRVVIDDVMPPAESLDVKTYDEASKQHLIAWLCRETGRDKPTCDRLVAFRQQSLTRSGRTILAGIARTATAPLPPERTELLEAVSPDSEPDAPPRTVLGPRIVGAALLVALDACGGSPPEARAACVSAALTRALRPPPGASAPERRR